jgi:hypothetical protein
MQNSVERRRQKLLAQLRAGVSEITDVYRWGK